MTGYVLDASFVASYFLPDETAHADHAAILESSNVFIAPWLIWAEFRNLLAMKVRRTSISRVRRR